MSAERSRDEASKPGFLPEEQGAVTVDFVVLAGGIIAMTIGISASVISSSLSLGSDTRDMLASISVDAGLGGSGGGGGAADDDAGESGAPPAAGNPGNDKPVGNAGPVPPGLGEDGAGTGNPGNDKPVGNAGASPPGQAGQGIGNPGNDKPVGKAGGNPSQSGSNGGPKAKGKSL